MKFGTGNPAPQGALARVGGDQRQILAVVHDLEVRIAAAHAVIGQIAVDIRRVERRVRVYCPFHRWKRSWQTLILTRLQDRKSFRARYLQPALAEGLIEMTIPDKPNSRLPRYRLARKGRQWLKQRDEE